MCSCIQNISNSFIYILRFSKLIWCKTLDPDVREIQRKVSQWKMSDRPLAWYEEPPRTFSWCVLEATIPCESVSLVMLWWETELKTCGEKEIQWFSLQLMKKNLGNLLGNRQDPSAAECSRLRMNQLINQAPQKAQTSRRNLQ